MRDIFSGFLFVSDVGVFVRWFFFGTDFVSLVEVLGIVEVVGVLFGDNLYVLDYFVV